MLWHNGQRSHKKVTAPSRRCESDCKRTAAASVTFCGKGEAAKQTNTPSKRWGICLRSLLQRGSGDVTRTHDTPGMNRML